MPFSINFLITSFKRDYLQLSAIVLLSILPILFFIGTGILNLAIIILDLIFIIEIVSKKKLFSKKYIFYSLIIMAYFLINVFFSIDPLTLLVEALALLDLFF